MIELIKSGTLLLTLLNPFLVIIYLIDPMHKLDQTQFSQVLIRAGIISSLVLHIFTPNPLVVVE